MGQRAEVLKDLAGFLYEETKEKLYKKIMKRKYESDKERFKLVLKTEEFQTDNPNLVTKLKAAGGFEALFMAAATVLGKYLQYEMKEKNKEKPSSKMLKQAIQMSKRYSDASCSEAIYRGEAATIKTLLSTWKYGRDLADAMGINEKKFTEMRKNVNNNYLDKAPDSSKNNQMEH